MQLLLSFIEIHRNELSDDFFDVTGTIKLSKGEQILTLEVTKEYFDIDYFEFKAVGDTLVDPPDVVRNVMLDSGKLQQYFVFDQMGVKLGVLSAYGFDAAINILRSSSEVVRPGVYYLVNRWSGEKRSAVVIR